MDPTTTTALLDPVLSDLAVVVDGIPPSADRRPTPCTDLDVAALRHHVLSWLTVFADGYADPDGRAPVGQEPADDRTGATVQDAARRLHDAVSGGAADRPLYLGESGMPGDMALSMILWEYLVHGWDLAVATGQPWTPADDACVAALDFAPGMLTPDYQGPGKTFGPRVPVPDDAPPLDRLLGLSGRDPGWRPAGG
ncbi:TIGR03086 family metal-binding protein [Nakamurella endophytica]|uniref:Mycothiol-dependent maleylpyruvate isomerase metal-binding domain-containing protein n=1 Tax=Nakamurella endophytica TaxID=1748367 RepID=A0A917WBW9_9ACTN|nr:TIGR03086 family metal-binding protein [Nakamurella endophytica]GGL92733.1 hypothetical protein GCM10011594_10670 [Nakamurella endophytica]